MATIQDIQALRAQLEGETGYTRPSSYKPYESKYTPLEYRYAGRDKPWNLNFDSLAKKDKKKSGINLWDVLSGTLGQAGGMVTNTAYNVLSDLKDDDKNIAEKLLSLVPINTFGSSAAQGVINGGKQQWKNWTDNDLSWGDVPGVGFLHGMDKGWKRGTDIMKDHTGVTNRWGVVGGGIGIDIALDPLTYLTGGLATASKLGKVAEAKKIAELGKKIGVTGKFKNQDEFLQAAETAIQKKYSSYPNLSQKMIDGELKKLTDEIKTARNTVYNDNINKWGVSVPFSNRMTSAVGDIRKGNLLHRTEATLGSERRHLVDELIKKATKGKKENIDNVMNSIKKIYKVDAVTELTKTQFDDLHKRLQPFARDGVQISRMVEKPFNEMNNAKTKFEHFLDKKNPFDARTLKTGDKFVDSMANHIADASSQRIGETAKYTKALSGIEKFIKNQGGTNEEKSKLMQEAIYVLEKEAPESLGKDWVPSAAAQKLASKIAPVLKAIGDDDIESGVLSSLRENYFPHVLNISDETRKSMDDFAKRHPDLSDFNGLNKGNKFDKTRKSFQTLAQRDNYIAKIEKAIQKETNTDTIESLRKQLEHVENVFDTNVVSALTRRIREGVRARSMKAMQGELSKFGMLKSKPKDDIVTETKGLTKLEPAIAKKLGLGEGEHYMHPDVLEGMKRMDDIFTDKGMEKWARHLSAISDIWRPLVTYYKPSHYINNLIGNSIMNMAAGVKFSDYTKAGKLIHGYRKGTLTPAQMRIMDKAYKHNVISGGFLTDAHATYNFDDPTKLEKVAKAVGENKTIKGVRATGELADDVTRLANFVGGLNKFGSAEKAAGQVREFLFNYNELTNKDRAARVAIPFWNWTKRNVPLQMKLLMENPKFAMNTERFKNLFNDGEEGQDWQKETGIKVSDNHYTSVPSPTHDLNTILQPLSMLSSMNPAIKIMIETAMNQKMYTKKPISYGEDNVQAEDLPAYIASNTGIGNDIYKMLSGQNSVPEGLLNLFRNTSKIDPTK